MSRMLQPLLTLALVGGLALAAHAQPWLDAGGTLTERDGAWGYRVNAQAPLAGSGVSLQGEWAADAIVRSYAANVRYRLGSDLIGVAPFVGWRGQVGGMTGPEVGLGGELAFSPQVPSLQADLGAIVGLNGTVLAQMRLLSRYRVLTWLDLQASYRLEQWASWTQVWGVGAHLVL